MILLGREDTRVGGHEEHKDAGGEEHGDERADGLSVELQVGRRLEEEADTEVGHESGGHVGGTRGHAAGDEIDALRVLDAEALRCGYAAKDKLRRLGRGSERGEIGHATAVDGEEGENDAEEGGQDGEARRHFPLELADDDCNHHDNEKHHDPNPRGHLLVGGGEVFGRVVLDVLGRQLCEEGTLGLPAFDEHPVNAAGYAGDRVLEGIPKHLPVHQELGHRVAH